MRFTAMAAGALLLVNAGMAQKTRTHSTRRQPVAAQEAQVHQCGHGISLRLSSPASLQGSLLLLELRSSEGRVRAVNATWDNRNIPFWEQKSEESQSADSWRALLGVDLELKPETYTLELKISTGSEGQFACSAGVAVKEGKFATERLKVAPNFVQPNPEQLARAEAERQRLRAIYATVTPERLWDGEFRYPLEDVHTGGNFGKRRILNGTPGSPHGGVDFPAPSGTPVYAAQRGRVVLAESLYFSGNTVILDHGLGLYTFYGHFESIAVKEGETVEKGLLIGKVGATGRVTGPHLHWGLSVNRARANPVQLIALFSESGPKTEPPHNNVP
jgi:murein DD-endopeptidase MepM/ murein hydrolase activator NlpD